MCIYIHIYIGDDNNNNIIYNIVIIGDDSNNDIAIM